MNWRAIAASALASIVACAAAADGDRLTACLIEPDEVLELSPPAAGVLDEVFVDRGDRVVRGDELARLEDDVERAAVALARARARNGFVVEARAARLAFLERRVKINADLAQRQAVSRTALDEAVTDAEVARQELAEASLQQELAELQLIEAEALLARRTLRSPIDGVVLERALGPGEYRDEQSHVVTVARLDPLQVDVVAPLSLLGEVAPGDPLFVWTETAPDKPLRATVTVVDAVLDAATGTFRFTAELPNADLAITAGLRCEAQVSP